MPDDLDPLSVFERLDDLGRYRNAADRLDIAPRHGLLIGDDRQRLHCRPRITRRLFRREPVEIGLQLRLRTETPAARDLGQLDAALGPSDPDVVEELADEILLERRIEQLGELPGAKRLAGDQQGRLENALDTDQIVSHCKVAQRLTNLPSP